MNKIHYTLLLILLAMHASAQDSLQLFYMGKIDLATTDSAALAQCKKKEYKSVSLEIHLISKNSTPETVYATGKDYRWWKDSVYFAYTVPASLYRQADSVVTHPTFQVACTGLEGNRGIENVEADGKESAVRNITLKFVSDPPGASVYLIPKMIWERTPALSKARSQSVLSHYAIYSGVTPVESAAQEYVYIALFKLNNRFVPVECSPTHFKTNDSVYANFSRQ